MTYLSTLHPKPNALRYTLYAPRWNFGTLNFISGKSKITENFPFPISNFLSLIML